MDSFIFDGGFRNKGQPGGTDATTPNIEIDQSQFLQLDELHPNYYESYDDELNFFIGDRSRFEGREEQKVEKDKEKKLKKT